MCSKRLWPLAIAVLAGLVFSTPTKAEAAVPSPQGAGVTAASPAADAAVSPPPACPSAAEPPATPAGGDTRREPCPGNASPAPVLDFEKKENTLFSGVLVIGAITAALVLFVVIVVWLDGRGGDGSGGGYGSSSGGRSE